MTNFIRDLADRITRTIQSTHGKEFEMTMALYNKGKKAAADEQSGMSIKDGDD